MNLYTLPGNFQIPIAANCNLHCTNCGFMDYEMTGKSTLIKNITLDGVKSIDKKITDLNLRLEEIELFGGEPTINPEFCEIVYYLVSRRGKLFDKLKCFTNGLNFTKDVVEALKKVDRIDISSYPTEDEKSIHEFVSAFEDSKISEELNYYIHGRDYFNGAVTTFDESIDIPDNFTNQIIFDSCFQKDDCRVVVMDGIYRCGMAHHVRKEMYKYDRVELIEAFVENYSKPLEYCRDCSHAKTIYLDSVGLEKLYRVKWTSNNKMVDIKNYKRGLRLIREYD